jgi:CheY-like chemotaxis protein
MQVLIADDDVVLRRAVRAHLERWGFEVVECADGQEAWAALQQAEPPPLAIVDWNMPGKDGVALCHELRERKPLAGIYVMLLTSNQEKKDVIAGLESGADDYVTKPVHWDELHARLRIGVRLVSLQQALAARVAELQEALSNVRQLSGLLPICAYCKRIRDDKNYWQSVEAYLSQHTETRFSHGICPSCYAKRVEPQLRRAKKKATASTRRTDRARP